jgi:hypothetical protein
VGGGPAVGVPPRIGIKGKVAYVKIRITNHVSGYLAAHHASMSEGPPCKHVRRRGCNAMTAGCLRDAAPQSPQLEVKPCNLRYPPLPLLLSAYMMLVMVVVVVVVLLPAARHWRCFTP